MLVLLWGSIPEGGGPEYRKTMLDIDSFGDVATLQQWEE
jgi:hypothetical protein